MDEARERLIHLAAQFPAVYFIHSVRNQTVVASSGERIGPAPRWAGGFSGFSGVILPDFFTLAPAAQPPAPEALETANKVLRSAPISDTLASARLADAAS